MHKKFLHNRSFVFVSDIPGTENVPIGTTVDIDIQKIFPYYIDDYTLEEAGIVEAGWQRAERPEKQALLSKVAYKNGLSFIAELNKIVFQNSNVQENNDSSDFVKRTLKLFEFIKTKEIILSSIGINFVIIIPMTQPENHFSEKFLKLAPIQV